MVHHDCDIRFVPEPDSRTAAGSKKGLLMPVNLPLNDDQ
jgi:hypothetical protein